MKDLYNANKYHTYGNNLYSWKYIERTAIKQLLQPYISNSTKILEAGCGYGRVIRYLIALGAEPKNIVGVDSNKEMLAIAKSKIPKATYIHADLGLGTTVSQQHDLIVTCMTLESLSPYQLRNACKFFYSGLKKNGAIFILVPHPIRISMTNKVNYFRKRKIKGITPWGETLVEYPTTVADYINTLIGVGFTIKKVVEPTVSKAGQSNLHEHQNYAQYPARLIVIAHK